MLNNYTLPELKNQAFYKDYPHLSYKFLGCPATYVKRLSWQRRFVLNNLVYLSQFGNPYISILELARRSHCSLRTVYRSLSQFEGDGIITRAWRPYTSNIYSLSSVFWNEEIKAQLCPYLSALEFLEENTKPLPKNPVYKTLPKKLDLLKKSDSPVTLVKEYYIYNNTSIISSKRYPRSDMELSQFYHKGEMRSIPKQYESMSIEELTEKVRITCQMQSRCSLNSVEWNAYDRAVATFRAEIDRRLGPAAREHGSNMPQATRSRPPPYIDPPESEVVEGGGDLDMEHDEGDYH